MVTALLSRIRKSYVYKKVKDELWKRGLAYALLLTLGTATVTAAVTKTVVERDCLTAAQFIALLDGCGCEEYGPDCVCVVRVKGGGE
jgi:hypothetical protein